MREGNDYPIDDAEDNQREAELHRLDALDDQRRAEADQNRAADDLSGIVPVRAANHRDRVFANGGGLDLEQLGTASRAKRGLRIGFGTALRTSHRGGLSGEDVGSSNHPIASTAQPRRSRHSHFSSLGNSTIR